MVNITRVHMDNYSAKWYSRRDHISTLHSELLYRYMYTSSDQQVLVDRWHRQIECRPVQLINASVYRPIGHYRRSKRRKSMTSLNLAADTPLRKLTLTLNCHFFCTNYAPFTTRNKHRPTVCDVSCLMMSPISDVRNANSGRYTDAFISYTAQTRDC